MCEYLLLCFLSIMKFVIMIVYEQATKYNMHCLHEISHIEPFLSQSHAATYSLGCVQHQHALHLLTTPIFLLEMSINAQPLKAY